MDIRRLSSKDSALLKDAVRELVASGDHHGPAGESHLARALADPAYYFILCLEGAEALGYLSAFRFPDVQRDGFLVYLYDLVVRPEHRRHGIGAGLIAELQRCCRSDNVTRIWVGTSLENRAAQRTFEATGAQRVSDTYAEYVYAMGGGPARRAV